MYKLSEINEVDLIYSNDTNYDNQPGIKYTIVLDVDNLISDIKLYQRIYKIVDLSKDIAAANNRTFEYHIITKKDMINEMYNDKALLEELANSHIMHAKHTIYEGNIINYKRSKKA